MQFRPRLKTFILLLVCLPSAILSAQSRPISFSGWDETKLRRGAMAELNRFAKGFPDNAVAAEAKRLVGKYESPPDPNGWIADTLEWVDKALKTNPPSKGNAGIRKGILCVVDYPLHVDAGHLRITPKYRPDWAQAVGRYFQKAVAPAIDQIASAKVANGLDIWKIYNMGFVVMSPNHCIGFDIHTGSVQVPYALSDEQQRVLINRLEILFITHWHLDHLDERFVRRMLAAGKTVVVPTPVRTDLKHEGVVRLYDNFQHPTEIRGMKVLCFPGWQRRDTPMGVYAVNMDGCWVAHNGDNRRTEIYAEIPKRCSVDVLLANCWSGFDAFAAATKPKLMITGHENELGHPASGRRPFSEMYSILDRMKDPPPYVILQWGERIHFGF